MCMECVAKLHVVGQSQNFLGKMVVDILSDSIYIGWHVLLYGTLSGLGHWKEKLCDGGTLNSGEYYHCCTVEYYA